MKPPGYPLPYGWELACDFGSYCRIRDRSDRSRSATWTAREAAASYPCKVCTAPARPRLGWCLCEEPSCPGAIHPLTFEYADKGDTGVQRWDPKGCVYEDA